MHKDESDVRDHLDSGTKVTSKQLTGTDQLTEEEKIKDDLSCLILQSNKCHDQINTIKIIHITTIITAFTKL